MVVDAPNVRSIVFNEHEGSYLVGMMAAMASESGTVGFIGGMEIYYSDRVSLDIGVEQLDAMGYNLGFTLKF